MNVRRDTSVKALGLGPPDSRISRSVESNAVRLQLSLLAYNLGNLWRRMVLPKRIDHWSLTSLEQRLVKTGRRLVKHARTIGSCWRKGI